MKKNRQAQVRLFLVLIVLTFCFICSPIKSVVAEDQNGSFVYSTNHFDGTDYSSSLIPSSVDKVYLLANENNAITPRLTELYYWALTNEYKASWEKLNIVLDGTVEIWQNGALVDELSQTDYVIQFDYLDKANTLGLFFGGEAEEKRDEFVKQRAEYRDALYAYQEDLTEYRSIVEEAFQNIESGTVNEDDLPQAPQTPADFSLFSSELLRGFIVNLPEGEYSLRFRLADGTLQVGSEKELIIFSEMAQGIGYETIAAERWTDPEYSFSPSETIYSISDKQIFLKPFLANKYNEQYYTRMNNPQDTASRSDRTVWIPISIISEGTLQLETGEQVYLKDYQVRQNIGSSLGYEIVESESDISESAAFTAFALATSDHFGEKTAISMVDSNASPLPGSNRDLRILQTDKSLQLTLFSIVPLFIGSAVFIIRQVHVKKGLKANSPKQNG